MAHVQGKEVLIKVKVSSAFTALTGEISCTLNLQKNISEVMTKSNTGWRSGTPDPKGWNVSGEGTVSKTASENAALDAIEDAWFNDAELEVEVVEPATLNTYTGKTYVSSYTKSAPAAGHYAVSFELFGNGTLTPSTSA